MNAVTKEDAITTITTHYIDGAFVESHGREIMDIVRPTDSQVIARVTLADEEDARRAIAAAKRAFATYGRSTKEERAEILRRLHKAVAAHIDDLTDAMVEEYGAPVLFCTSMMEAAANVFVLHAYVSGTDVGRARHVASRILAGRVAINGLLDDQQAPFGGFKNSGVGREFGTYGIEAFLEPRAILEA